jgi:hypothetical protein
VDGEDPTRTVGDRDDAADAPDLVRDRSRGAAELGEHDLVIEPVLGGGLVLHGRGRRMAQARIDVVLLAAAIPGRGHLGSDPTNTVVPGEKPFPRCRDRPVPLCVNAALALCGLGHLQGGST